MPSKINHLRILYSSGARVIPSLPNWGSATMTPKATILIKAIIMIMITKAFGLMPLSLYSLF